MLSARLKHWQLSCPCAKLTSSFLSEVISSVDVLHKHRTNIQGGEGGGGRGEEEEEEGGSGALVLKKRADGKHSPFKFNFTLSSSSTDKRFGSHG